MARVSDEERRDVARRLREYVDLPDDWWQETSAEFYVEKCVFGNVDRHSEAELFKRLADLIEPSCDRDAMLALAVELDELERHYDGKYKDTYNLFYSGVAEGVYIAADMLREALGVDDA